ncbi:MAG TPA: serine hydrolase [Longimicrobiales bacterium]|nr:serine hydrolase [Longimicrobiales bacterium]
MATGLARRWILAALVLPLATACACAGERGAAASAGAGVGGRDGAASGGATGPAASVVRPAGTCVAERDLALADSAVAAAVGEGVVPGAVLLVSCGGEAVHQRAFGFARLREASAGGSVVTLAEPIPMTVDHAFDLASVTKVMATTFAMMVLVDRGAVDLEAPVGRYLPEFRGGGKDSVRVRDLLTHRAGLYQWRPTYFYGASPGEAYAYIRALPLAFAVGEHHYSDLGFMLLGYLVERVTGSPLDEFVAAEVYGPLGLEHTAFLPRDAGLGPFAATSHGNPFERRMVEDDAFGYQVDEDPGTFSGWRTRTLAGEVNDGNAFYTHGGVAGHAGLFSTAADLNVLLALLLGEGEYRGQRLIRAVTVRRFLQPGADEQGLGWRVSGDAKGDVASFWHTGFTGTYVYARPDRRLAVVLLTNRQNLGVDERGYYPDVGPLRRAVVSALSG